MTVQKLTIKVPEDHLIQEIKSTWGKGGSMEKLLPHTAHRRRTPLS
jgi:hypothetical protein